MLYSFKLPFFDSFKLPFFDSPLPFGSFIPHVGDVFAAISPLVDFTWHEEVRNLCARILPKLFTLLVNGLRNNQTTAQQCLDLYNETVKMLIEQYTAEDAATERSCIAESLRDIFCVAPQRPLKS